MSVKFEKSMRSCTPPRRTIPIGGTFILGGKEYIVECRGEVSYPREACIGCAFASRNCPEYLACSSFDRRDGVSVWFKVKG